MLESLTFGLLLEEAIKTGLGALVSAGLGRPAKDLLERLSGGEAKKHSQALEQAYQAAAQAFGAGEAVGRLLRHEPFRREVLTRLLDPASAVDVDAIAAKWSDDLPPQRRALQNFFTRLEDALLRDPYWGEIIERYQNLRAGKEAQSALRAHGLPVTEREVVTQVFNTWNLSNAGSVVTGKVQAGGDFVGRDKNEQTVNGGVGVQNSTIGTVNINPDPRQAEAERAEQAFQAYLAALWKRCQVLPLAALGGDEGRNSEVRLDQVYIRLDTTEKEKPAGNKRSEENKERPVPVWDVAARKKRLVILGDPGSGKSTFVHHLVSLLAGAQLGELLAEQVQPFGGLTPVLVTLRELAPQLGGLGLAEPLNDRQRDVVVKVVEGYLAAELERYECAGALPRLKTDLHNCACLLALDGLDEVPCDLRLAVRLAVAALLDRWNPARLLITCRVRSYEGQALAGLPTCTLAPLDKDKIEAFCRDWYRAQSELGRFSKDDAAQRSADLAQAAVGELGELAANPMLLTTMALIHQREIRLPKQRVRLYTLAVDILLRRWQQGKAGMPEALGAFLSDDRRLRDAMQRLAYEAHAAGCANAGLAELGRGRALELLDLPEYLGNAGAAAEFLDYVDQRAGLLVGRGGVLNHPTVYTFPHRTFQEYLAGCYLFGGRARDAEERLRPLAAQAEVWNLAVEFGAEELLYNSRSESWKDVLDIAYRLLRTAAPAGAGEQRCALWAGKIVALVGAERAVSDDARFVERARTVLVGLLGGELRPPERVDAGRALARLGDPRFRADAWYLPDEPLLGFVKIPAGKFWMGSNPKKDSGAFGDEQPQHEVHLPEYWLGRYPVTVAQFGAFVTESGFKPGDPDCLHGLPNHPVVWVSWHEALAYCDWLTGRLRCWPGAPAALRERLAAGWRVLLPGEAEWEKAARGVDGCIYPWGEVFDAEKANTEETGIGDTSAVGCFPGGAGPYGLLDMSGNVWEWTRSLNKEYPYVPTDGREDLRADGGRTVRGGAFFNESRYARCAFRDWADPDIRLWYYGFRVAFLPAPVGADSEL